MAEVNILNRYPKVARNVTDRKKDKARNRARSMQFEQVYFDGTREEG